MEASDARDCTVEDCVFSHLGGYAIAFDKGSVENHIVGNELADLGGGGVKLGDVACGVHPVRQTADRAVQAALVRRTGSRWPLDPADYRADRDFPHSEAETTRTNVVADNRIHDIGSVFPGAVGIWVGQSCGNTLRTTKSSTPITREFPAVGRGGLGLPQPATTRSSSTTFITSAAAC